MVEIKETGCACGRERRCAVNNVIIGKGVVAQLPEPDEMTVGSVFMHFDPSCDLVVAVDSGVIGDVSKVVATVAGLGYIIVATAPSMDGYASSTFSMARDGVKVSLSTKCPEVIIENVDIRDKYILPRLLWELGLLDEFANSLI